MPKLTIDNRSVEVAAGGTILDAARELGIDIPTLCFHSSCSPSTSCLCCVVKVNGKDRLLPSCATKVAEGMMVESETDEVRGARRMALELLLADHAGDCWAPCTNICPAGMDIPTMIRQINAGELREALVTVKRRIALPAVLGRICPELCEKGCRRAQRDSAVSICTLKRFVADVDLESGDPYLPACLPDSGKYVAIIGAGPAGLAAGYYLQQRGHQCVIFDGHPAAGGNLRYAIAPEKLPAGVVEAEVDLIRRLGVQFRFGVCIGRDVAMQDLQQQFDAVLVAVGEVDGAKATALGLEMAGRGLKVHKRTMMTDVAGVFVAGAAITPYRHAIRAIAAGREAAEMIDRYILEHVLVSSESGFTSRLGPMNEEEYAAFSGESADVPRAAMRDDAAGLSVEQAMVESGRCLQCDCGKLEECRLRHYAVRYDANPGRYKGERRSFERTIHHPQIVYESGKCISCGLCVQVATREGANLGLTYVGRGFDIRIGVPFNETLGSALGEVGRKCAEVCPTGALAFQRPLRCVALPVVSEQT